MTMGLRALKAVLVLHGVITRPILDLVHVLLLVMCSGTYAHVLPFQDVEDGQWCYADTMSSQAVEDEHWCLIFMMSSQDVEDDDLITRSSLEPQE
jgi:hypothetical protein